ncbi:U3 small nucleolar RNA-associated 14 [Lecanosticta acicola]|uniref:U3 small nucleolar RNA-associated 14 n=1 Tax=Lecanosticta acicola TaxID=111012 RepID=A0AAI8Z5N8_9PEZI|nr:U3 small nucleolar RNA-associated 14 [Lecanosticta acicola]
MPARVARSSTSAAVPKNARNKNKKRSLDAYSQAQKLIPEKGPARHRLGEDIDDEPRQKRRRRDSEEDDEDEEEEEPQRKRPNKRSFANDQDDEDVEYGSDPDGNQLTLGGIAEDDDDSDLDSDEAFGESDEERFEGFTFRGSKSSKGKTKVKKPVASSSKRRSNDINLNEKDESEDDDGDSQDDEGLGFGDDAVDLAAMLDDDHDEILGGKDTPGEDMGEQSEGESEEDDESESEEEDDEDEGDEEEMKERSARIMDRLEALDAPARQAPAPQASEAVTVDDFMADTELAPEKTSSKSKKKAAKPTAIAAPLPKRQQDRLDREVATEKAKQQLDRWRDTVIRNRRAEFLNFPLQNPADQNGSLGKEKFVPSTQEKPQNELEESIQRIMEESGLVAKQGETAKAGNTEAALLIKSEELAEKKLPVEEVMRRRAELRKVRELLFREELKAKRIAKIKSKSYRRVHRKERERQAAQEREALEGMGIDPMDEDEKERTDRKRAEARMGTKHKDSKWAKSIKQTNRTAWDDDARDGVVEQARRNEELRKRIAGRDVSDGSDVSSDEETSDNQTLMKKLHDLEGANASEPKGLAGLKFMRAADERRRKQNDEDVERIRKELAIADGDEEESEDEEEGLGRAIFGPQKKEEPRVEEARLEFEAPESDDEEEGVRHTDENEKKTASSSVKAAPKVNARTTRTADDPPSKSGLKKAEHNDERPEKRWLEDPVQKQGSDWLKAPKKSRKSAPVDVEIDTLQASRPANAEAPAKHANAVKAEKARQASERTAENTNGWTTVTYNHGSDAEGSDEETADPVLNAKQQKQSLLKRAFAGDDVQTAFDAEKEELAVSEDEKEVSHYLPGWGAWAGSGLTKKQKAHNERRKHNPLFKAKTNGVKQADRKDAKLKNVVISEKDDRKGKKYLASVLPHEFENQEQYERSKRLPMGPEWTTKEVHQRMTRPRVVVKPGVNMTALEKPVA